MESQRASEALRVGIAVGDDMQRETLASLLSQFDDVEVVGCDKDGRRALRKTGQTQADLVFLDRGMLTLRELRAVRDALQRGTPLIAFVMTTPQPVDVFEPNAIDYLLLPATRNRARVTLERAKERLEAESFAALRGQPESAASAVEP